ncbi:MAG: hypothetical protein V3T21_02490 [Candidatus Margulisiibacteriota bacterium]
MIKPVNRTSSNSALLRTTIKGVPLQRIRDGLLNSFRTLCQQYCFSLKIETHIQSPHARFDIRMRNHNYCQVAAPDAWVIKDACLSTISEVIPGIAKEEKGIKIIVSATKMMPAFDAILLDANGEIHIQVKLEGLLDR